jgi:nucleolar protein 56
MFLYFFSKCILKALEGLLLSGACLKNESIEEKRKRLLAKARESLSTAYAGEEHSLIEAINTYLQLEKIENLVFERLEEWYSIYFPELKLGNHESYAKFVKQFGLNKKAASEEELAILLGDKSKAKEVAQAISKSIGREPTSEEYKHIASLADMVINFSDLRKNLGSFIDSTAKKLMPNITYLIDAKISAELLSKAGSLNKLALMPASTIQLLGAEKALFKHIKYGSKPPKYGILFKLPEVSSAGKKRGGRVARIYATKISIAAKADAFSKRFIAEDLKKSLIEALQKGQKNKR